MFEWTSEIIAAASVITAATVILTTYNKVHKWVLRQAEIAAEVKKLHDEHCKDIEIMRAEREQEFDAFKEELQILTRGMLACLRGLQEQGCNGPVTEAINSIETHLNKKAHE